MNPDGNDQTNISHNPASDSHPAWSPDGDWIVFRSYRDGNSEIYKMHADGSEQTRLTDNPAFDAIPGLDERRQDPLRARHVWRREIYIMNADGSAAEHHE